MLNSEQESCNGSNEDKLSPMPELIDDIKNTKSHIPMSNKKKRRVRIAAVFGSGTPEDKKINKTSIVDAEHLTMLQSNQSPVQYKKDSTDDKPYSISTFQTQQNGTEPVQYEQDSTEDKPYSISTFHTQQNGIEPDSSYTSTTNVLWKFSSDQSDHLLNHKQIISAKNPVAQLVRENPSLHESTACNQSVEDQILFTQVENRTLKS